MIPTGFCLLIHLLVHSSHSKPDTHVHVYVPPEKGGKVLFCFEKKKHDSSLLMVPGHFLFSLGGAPTGGLLNQRSGGDFGHDYQEEG